MNRRNFIQHGARVALAAPFIKLPDVLSGKGMGIVVHSYGHRWDSKAGSEKYPGFFNAIDLLDHCRELGGAGVQVVVRNWTPDFTRKVKSRLDKTGMYLEGSVALPKTSDDKSRFEEDVKCARDAGAEVIRTVCLSGRRYENFHSLREFQEFRKNSVASLQMAEPVMAKYRMKLAIENHKDWRARELADVLKEIGSEWTGVTVDFGNSISLMEDPIDVVNTLGPYIFSTHVKDMAVQEYDEGFLLSEVPLGQGFLNLRKMCDICREHNPKVNFNLEMITRDPLKIPCLTEEYWSTFTSVDGKELARTLRMVREKRPALPLPEISGLTAEEQLAVEEKNIVACLEYSRSALGMR